MYLLIKPGFLLLPSAKISTEHLRLVPPPPTGPRCSAPMRTIRQGEGYIVGDDEDFRRVHEDGFRFRFVGLATSLLSFVSPQVSTQLQHHLERRLQNENNTAESSNYAARGE